MTKKANTMRFKKVEIHGVEIHGYLIYGDLIHGPIHCRTTNQCTAQSYPDPCQHYSQIWVLIHRQTKVAKPTRLTVARFTVS